MLTRPRCEVVSAEEGVSATWSVFDTCDGPVWPSHEDIEVEGATREEVLAVVADELDTAAYGCRPSDGYEVGDRIVARVWWEDETMDKVSVVLTHEHLGLDDDVTVGDER